VPRAVEGLRVAWHTISGNVRHLRGFVLFGGGTLATLVTTQNIKIAYSLVNGHITAMAKTSKAVKKKRTPNAAFMKPVQPDEKLALVVGAKPLPRTELTKKLWVYIRKNGLQDKKVRTQINADENLKAVFNGKKSVSMFEMTKLVSGHVKK
jgi:chromatin remodeling complex protein RSC6